MFKNKLKTFFVLLIVALITLSSVSFADIEEDTVTNHDEYLIGTDINVNYDIEGNLYILGNNVTISSKVIGNAFICANNLTVTSTGYISNSMYAAANTISFNGKAYDIYATCENFNFEGSTFRDIHSAANNIILNGTVGRDANIAGESFIFGGKIEGDLNYSAKQKHEIPEGVVAGNIKYEELKEFNIKPNYFMLAACFVGLVLVLWLFMKWLAPSFLSKTDAILANSPLKTLGIGLLSFITVPGIAVLLMVTGVAAYAGILLLATYCILACISSSIFVIAINNLLAKKFNFDKAYKTFLLLIVTSIIAWALTVIPFVGAIVSLVYVLCGFGIVIRKLLNNRKEIVAE